MGIVLNTDFAFSFWVKTMWLDETMNLVHKHLRAKDVLRIELDEAEDFPFIRKLTLRMSESSPGSWHGGRTKTGIRDEEWSFVGFSVKFVGSHSEVFVKMNQSEEYMNLYAQKSKSKAVSTHGPLQDSDSYGFVIGANVKSDKFKHEFYGFMRAITIHNHFRTTWPELEGELSNCPVNTYVGANGSCGFCKPECHGCVNGEDCNMCVDTTLCADCDGHFDLYCKTCDANAHTNRLGWCECDRGHIFNPREAEKCLSLIPLPVIETCENIAEFEAKLAAESEVLLAMFVASDDPATGESWCIVCRNAYPFIERAKPKIAHKLIICPVGQRSEWDNTPNNPYRIHPDTMVTSVPSLVRYERGVEVDRLIDYDILDQPAVDEFVSRPISPPAPTPVPTPAAAPEATPSVAPPA
jgi:hypothetical protein